jgi:hypothetical protein
MTRPTNNVRLSWRLFWRCGVVGLGVIAIVGLIGGAWYLWRRDAVEREERAIAQLPGVVLFRHERWEYGGPEGPVAESDLPGPAWLRRVVGERMFFVPNELWLELYDIKNEDLAVLKDLPTLRKVELSGTPITDEALENLAPLTDVEDLQLSGTKISSRAIVDLDRFANLKVLELPEFEEGAYDVDDLQVLSKLTKLEELVMHFNPLGEQGLAYLADLKRLRVLGINGCDAPAGSFRHLARLENLDWLLAITPATNDEDAAHLSRCRKLRVLFLDGENLTPVGCESLALLENLEELRFFKLRIDEQNVAAFVKLPRLKTIMGESVSDGARKRLEAARPGLVVSAVFEEGEDRNRPLFGPSS